MPGEFIARNGVISRGNVVVTGSLTTSGSLTTTGTITATTLVVQTITSSISSVTGSTNFGSLVSNTHTFTGSLNVTGGLAVTTNGVEFQVNSAGVNLGNALTDSHIISGSLRVNPNGLFVSGSGLVGIGTIVPSFTLDVSGSGRFINTLTISSNVDAGIIAATSTNTAFTYIDLKNTGASGRNYQIGLGGNAAAAGYANNLYFDLVGVGNIMTLTSGRNVGIGTSSPNGNLEVYAATPIIISGATSAASFHGFEFRQNNTIDAFIKQLPQTGELKLSVGRNSSWGGHMTFFTDTLERIRITSGGNVGLATSSPAALLSLKGRGGADIIFQMNDETDTRRCFYIPNQYYGYMWAVGVVSNGGKAFSLGNASGTEVGTIVINAGGVAYNTTSDYRLKEDLKDFNGLEKVSAIKVYDFKWKNLNERTDGVLAHELAEVLPYAVSGTKDALNHEGNIEAQSVDYSKLTPVLVKAIQEQQALITDLRTEIEELKARI